jgi:hypothetical protein
VAGFGDEMMANDADSQPRIFVAKRCPQSVGPGQNMPVDLIARA